MKHRRSLFFKIFLSGLLVPALLAGVFPAFGPIAARADAKVQIVGTPVIYVQSGGEAIISMQVKNLSGAEIRGVSMAARSYDRLEEYGTDSVILGSSYNTTTDPEGTEKSLLRFTPYFERSGYPAQNAVWDSEEEGYTIGKDKTATLWFKVWSDYEAPGTYNEWIRFIDCHTEYYAGILPVSIRDRSLSGQCAVKVTVYNPSNAAVTLGTSTNYGRDITTIPLGSTIDFGTVSLAGSSGLTAQRTYYTRNTGSYSGGTDEHGLSSDISVDLSVKTEDGSDWLGDSPFDCNSNLMGGTHWAPLPAAPMSASEYSSAQTGIMLDAEQFVEGTYRADFVLTTVPHGVKVNGSSIHTNGVYTWPVKVTLTGTNPRIPKAPVNVTATAGNGLVEVDWNAAAGETEGKEYYVYRREGSESSANRANLSNAAFNWEDYSMVGSAVPNDDGDYVFVDGTVTNDKTYTYVVTGGEALKAYPAISAAVTPKATLSSRLLKPERVYADDQDGGVLLQWEMNENYGGDLNDGSSMVDHFNIYRENTLVMQVMQNAVTETDIWDWAPSPEDPDSYTYQLVRSEYGWSVFLETPLPYQNFTWNVAAVSKSGVEGYWSDSAEGCGMDGNMLIAGHSAYYYNDPVPTFDISFVNSFILGPEQPERIDLWRAAGTAPPDTSKAPHLTNDRPGYSVDASFTDDKNVKAGTTYTYTARAMDYEGHVSNEYTFTVKAQNSSGCSYTAYSAPYADWSVSGGKSVLVRWVPETDDEYRPLTEAYKIYRNGVLQKTVNITQSSQPHQSFSQDPGSDGTYVYRIDRIINGITVRGRDFTFYRKTAAVDPGTLLKEPGKPLLTARVSDGIPVLRWAPSEEGGAPDGYHIYRKDGGVTVNGTHNVGGYTVRWNNKRYLTIDDPGIRSLSESGGSFDSEHPEKGYLENVSWYEDACPHEYWITAYNAAGESAPSEIVTLDNMGLDEDGYPVLPDNEDEYAPGAPSVGSLWVEWEDTSDCSVRWDDAIGGYIRAAWTDPASGAGMIDRWDVICTGLRYGNTDTEKLWFWQAVKDPEAKSGSGQYAPGFYVFADEGESGDYGRTAEISVTAVNSAGSAGSETAGLTIRSFPRSRVLPGNGSVKIEWTDLFNDTVTQVTGWEIWRKAEFGSWQNIQTFDASLAHNESGREGYNVPMEYYSWRDEGVRNGWTYQYRVVAKCADGIDRPGVVREASPLWTASDAAPSAPRNLTYEVVDGQVCFHWDPPAEGTAQYYGLVYEYRYGENRRQWSVAETVSAPSTDLVWTYPQTGETRCFVYAYCYLNGDEQPARANEWEFDDPENHFAEIYPSASNIVTINLTDAQTGQQPDDYPGSFTLTAVPGDNKVTLNWTKSAGASYYEIRRHDFDGAGEFNTVTLPASARTYTDDTAMAGCRYTYQVNAYNSYGSVYQNVNAVPYGKTKDEEAAEIVGALIDALPDPESVILDDEEEIEAVREVYDALTDRQKGLISAAQRNKLEECVSRLGILKLLELYADVVEPVQALIDALPDAADIALSDAEAVTAAREAYNTLTPAEAKKLVDTSRLVAAEEAIDDLRYDLSHASVEVSGIYMIGGTQRPSVTVTMNGEILSPGTDYTIAGYSADDPETFFDTVTAPGLWTPLIEGTGRFRGRKTGGSFKAYDVNDDLANAVIAAPSDRYPYTGSPVSPSFDVYLQGRLLTEGTDYVTGGVFARTGGGENDWAQVSNAVGAGEYRIVLSARDGAFVYGETTYAFTVDPLDIADGSVSALVSPESVPWSDPAAEPAVSVTHGGTALLEGTDYSLSFVNNTAVGTAQAVLEGMGNYTGRRSVSFTITEPSADPSLRTYASLLEELTGNVSDAADAANTAQETLSSAQLTEENARNELAAAETALAAAQAALEEALSSGDQESVDAAQAALEEARTRFEAAQAACGSAEAAVSAAQGALEEAQQTLAEAEDALTDASSLEPETLAATVGDHTYTGESIVPHPVVTKTWEGTSYLLTEGVHYTAAAADGYDNVNAGENTAALAILHPETGETLLTVPFTIVRADISGAETVCEKEPSYTGQPQMPLQKVLCTGRELIPETDYTVQTEGDTVHPGTLVIRVTGYGNYSGTAECVCEIVPAVLTAVYEGETVRAEDTPVLAVSVTGFVNGESPSSLGALYTAPRVEAPANLVPGTSCELIPSGGSAPNYRFVYTAGILRVRDAVRQIYDAAVTGISGLTYTGSALRPKPVVKITSGNETETLTEGTDYTVSYKNNTNAGTATVTITGTGGYEGSVSRTFQISPASLKSCAVNGVADKRYTGKAQTQSPVVSFNGKTLKSGTDYTLSYKNNTKAGTATVTVTGKGNFKDAVPKTFKIVSAAGWERLTGVSGTGALGTQAQITGKFARSDVAVIATNADFKDALAAVALAGAYNAPVITNPKGSLSPLVKDELTRLGVTRVFILGTTSDVSANVENQIKALPKVKTVERIAASGASAKAVAAASKAAESATSKTVIVATQKSFKDALSISPYAYATKSPIIYVESNLSLSNASLKYIKDAGFTQAVIVGGPVAIPDAVKTQLTKNTGVKNITRLGGAGCYNTSRIIGEWEMGKLKNGTNGKTGSLYKYVTVTFQPAAKLGINNVGVSRGDNWKDAIAGSALCGMNRAVLLLADGSNSVNTAVVKAYKTNVAKGYVFGGTQAVPAKVYNQFVAASK